jgi:uncharacterized ParB-like nuclease family protein
MVIFTRVCCGVSGLHCFGETLYYKFSGCKMNKTHISWTLDTELSRLGYKPQAMGAINSACDQESDGRF